MFHAQGNNPWSRRDLNSPGNRQSKGHRPDALTSAVPLFLGISSELYVAMQPQPARRDLNSHRASKDHRPDALSTTPHCPTKLHIFPYIFIFSDVKGHYKNRDIYATVWKKVNWYKTYGRHIINERSSKTGIALFFIEVQMFYKNCSPTRNRSTVHIVSVLAFSIFTCILFSSLFCFPAVTFKIKNGKM